MLRIHFVAVKLFVILMAYISLFLGIFTENGKKLDIIHNYGHGGSGITLAYGCAIDVSDMVECIMKFKSKL